MNIMIVILSSVGWLVSCCTYLLRLWS